MCGDEEAESSALPVIVRFSDHSRRAETIFPANQELDISFPQTGARPRHASAPRSHRPETGANAHRGAGTQ